MGLIKLFCILFNSTMLTLYLILLLTKQQAFLYIKAKANLSHNSLIYVTSERSKSYSPVEESYNSLSI